MNLSTLPLRLTADVITKRDTPWVALTAYTAPIARIVDKHADIILVGDSVGMTVYGFNNTLSVTLDMMINHGAAVVRSTQRALVIVDMPINTYEHDRDVALANAQRIIRETGAQAIKLEGGADMADTVRHLVQNGIAVQGHIGLMPQSVEKIGGFKIQGRDEAQATQLVADALALQDAGAFSIVIEGTVEPVARSITEAVKIPTIGIGASVACDGQILVIDDIISLTERKLTFAKRYGDAATVISNAIADYADDVRARRFPTAAHTFAPKL